MVRLLEIEKFIIFVKDLALELFYDKLGTQFDVFQICGCYEFCKILKCYYPEGKFYTNITNDHCVFFYKNKLYDSDGNITNDKNNEYREMNHIDHNYATDFEKKLNFNNLGLLMIDELLDCRIKAKPTITYREMQEGIQKIKTGNI